MARSRASDVELLRARDLELARESAVVPARGAALHGAGIRHRGARRAGRRGVGRDRGDGHARTERGRRDPALRRVGRRARCVGPGGIRGRLRRVDARVRAGRAPDDGGGRGLRARARHGVCLSRRGTRRRRRLLARAHGRSAVDRGAPRALTTLPRARPHDRHRRPPHRRHAAALAGRAVQRAELRARPLDDPLRGLPDGDARHAAGRCCTCTTGS